MCKLLDETVVDLFIMVHEAKTRWWACLLSKARLLMRKRGRGLQCLGYWCKLLH